jgi:DMSO/TMAO reductase YedYZ heme-binding membrane subunit
MNPQLTWYVARAGGIVAWGLLTGGVVMGLLLAAKLPLGPGTNKWLLDIHRFLAALAIVFSAVHMGALVADSYVDFGARELFVPFASEWQPGAVAWGVAAFHLLIAIEVSSLAMRHIRRSLWRTIHELSFVVWGFATVHGITAGTDATNAIYRYVTIFTLQLIPLCIALRLWARNRARADRRPAPAA